MFVRLGFEGGDIGGDGVDVWGGVDVDVFVVEYVFYGIDFMIKFVVVFVMVNVCDEFF